MKRLPIFAFALLMSASMAHAQTFSTSDRAGRAQFAPCALGTDDITQNADCSVEPLTGVSCNAGGIDAGNQYLRRFNLTADHGITQLYTVDAVQFGVEVADAGAGFCAGVPLDINVYSIPIGAPFLYSNMVLEDTVSMDGTGTAGSIATAVMTGAAVIDPSTDDLVVELMTCDSSNNGDFGSFYPGANGAVQTGPTYIASDSCGILDPDDLANVGFPDSHNIFVVQGTETSAYDFVGFFPPIDNPPNFNKAEPGSEIVLSFSLTGDFGLDILARNSPLSRRIDCSQPGRPLSRWERTLPRSGGLSYDASSDTYSFGWQTSGDYGRSCRQFVLRLNDGSVHHAYFQFGF